MGIFSKIFRKKEEPKLEEKPEITLETTSLENLRAKMDLLMTQLESLKIQNNVLTERMERIEKILNEIYVIAKRS